MAISDLGTGYYILEWLIRLAALVIVPFKRKSTAAAWLLFFFLLPVVGLLLFLAIGEPHFPRWRVKRFKELLPFYDSVSARLLVVLPEELGDVGPTAELAHTLGHFPAFSGNSIELIDDYDLVVSRLIEDIDAARSHVRLLIYIFADDGVGQLIVNALARAVSRGVRCHVLVDPVGSRQWIRSTVRKLTTAGVSTREALPFHWLRGRTRRDMRNHRKLFIIDGVIGYAGSQNLVAKDFNPAVVNRELVARCTGPIVSTMEAVTLVDWALESQDGLPSALPVPPNTGSAILQLLPSGADFPLEGFQTLLVWQLHQARRTAIIVTPYFIPDEDVIGALRTAVARGVRVDIIVSAVVDQRLVNLAQRSYYEELISCGVRIFEFRNYFLHAKNVSIDGQIGIVGSSNVDLRSFQLNEEVSLLLLDQNSVAALEMVQRRYLENSIEVELERWRERGLPVKFAENIARLISPVL